MAKITTVDYEKMPGQAKTMRSYGQQLNNEMTKAYESITNMHNNWYGKRYNELVQQFNNMVTQLNTMLNLVVTEIPSTLETIANNYAQADKGQNVTSVSKDAPKKITPITIHNDVGMKFITSEVIAVQKSVSTNFKNAKEQMNKIETEYGKVTWQSEASEAFKTKFSKLKTNIVTSCESIESQFTTLMNQTQNDVQSAENANTVQ